MTPVVNSWTLAALSRGPFDPAAALLAGLALALLIGLLVAKELVRAAPAAQYEAWARTLDTAAAPLLVAFGLILAVRVWILLSSGQ